MKLDFSEFHDLFHPIWKCHGYGRGGWRRHIKYASEFQWKPRWKARTYCRLGHHDARTWFRHVDGATRAVRVICWNCNMELPDVVPDSPETMERFPPFPWQED